MKQKITFKNLTNRFFATSDEYEESTTPITYISAKNGNFVQRKNTIGRFITKTDGDNELQEIEEGLYLDIPKIPFSLFNDMAAWFKTIYQKDKTESTIFILMNNETKNFIPFVPLQENAGAASDYKRHDDPDFVEIEKTHTLVMVAHSHPWKGVSAPGPSGTDNKDEKEAILYMIMNNVEDIPYYFCSTCPDATRQKLNLFDIFENPLLSNEEDQIKSQLLAKYVPEREVVEMYFEPDSIEVPEHWLAKHSTRAASYTNRYGANKYVGSSSSTTNLYEAYNRAKYKEYNFDGMSEVDKKNMEIQNSYFQQERDNARQLTLTEEGWRTPGYGKLGHGYLMNEDGEYINENDLLAEYLDTMDTDTVADLILDLPDSQIEILIDLLIDNDNGEMVTSRLVKSKQVETVNVKGRTIKI